MKIYTGTGDDGTTSLMGGKRVPKDHPRVEAYGSVDELIAWIGLLRDHAGNTSCQKELINIQEQLMSCAGALACEDDKSGRGGMHFVETGISFLEDRIDRMDEKLPPLNGFILPGGHKIVSYCHIARCVCRRAERAVTHLNSIEKIPLSVPKFLNRLSDYLFVLSRYVSLDLDI